MDVFEAKEILDSCDRQELRDHAFGDMEISWTRAGYEVAYGYSTGVDFGVHIVSGPTFQGEEAKSLVGCGNLNYIERNDEVGPNEFELGKIMPGLTRHAVLQEIKQHYQRNRLTDGFRH